MTNQLSFDKNDIKMVKEHDIEENAIKLDPDQEINIANIDRLSDNIIIILEFMNKPEIKELKKTNIVEYEQMIEKRFQPFADHYYSIFKMIISGADITNLFDMMRELDKVNKGKETFEGARNNISQKINKQYIDPKLNKKNKKKKKN